MSILSLSNEKLLAQYAKTVKIASSMYYRVNSSYRFQINVLFLQRNWNYSDGYYTFGEDVNEMSVDEEMPYVNVAKKMLQYAREMEMII